VSEPTELYSLLIPLRGERLLVPRMCVAEVIPFTDTDRDDIEGAPSWLIGSVDWNGRKLPVVSFDSSQSDESMIARKRGARSRVVVFHAISDQTRLRHYGVLTQGFPQLVRVNRDVITLDSEAEIPEDQPILCRVRMIHEFPLIPDLEAIEEKLAALEAGLVN
jgi:chemosensory pili system protein ChpC